MSVKIIITTSDAYHHCLPVFFDCYKRHWDDPFELVGYKFPDIPLPSNCTFVSLGKQRGAKFFSDDLAAYFKEQPQWFMWMMEDSFIKGFNRQGYKALIEACTADHIGRINLTNEGMKRKHTVQKFLYFCDPDSLYRLSTQPSIWNRDFLLQYMTPGLTPWQFETQPTKDDYEIVGPVKNVLDHNEGVRKHDISKLNLEGLYD